MPKESGHNGNGSPAGTRTKPTSAADAKWGYQFSIDGLMDVDEAETFLGDVSRRTPYRRTAKGLIRTGKDAGRTVFCRRSVVEYAASLER